MLKLSSTSGSHECSKDVKLITQDDWDSDIPGLSDPTHILSLDFLDVCVNVEGVAVSLISLQWGRCVNFAVFLKVLMSSGTGYLPSLSLNFLSIKLRLIISFNSFS